MKTWIRLLFFLGILGTSLSVYPQSGEQQMKIEDYVRQVFIEGIPYEDATKYKSSDVPTLLRMLANPEEKPHWPIIVTMLGIIGDEIVLDPMIAFIEAQPKNKMDITDYRAKTSAIMSLGYLVNLTRSEKALNYLVAGMEPDKWEKRRIKGVAPYQKTNAERNKDLAQYAILGLALSGDPRAAETLESFEKKAARGSKELQTFEKENRGLIKNSLKENKMISEKGLRDYYRFKSNPKPISPKYFFWKNG